MLADRLDPAAAARAEAGRNRIEERRTERALDALPPCRLAVLVQKADRLDPVAAALAKSQERITAVRAREPWPDPTSRDRREIANSAKDGIDAAVKRALAVAAEAEARHRQAVDRIGFLDRLASAFGRKTEAILAERAAAAEAESLRFDADTQTGSHGRRLNQVDVDAPNTVRSRERERDRWLESREVVSAVREAHGNDLVEKAIEAGTPGIEALARRDLAAARELLLRQEAEREAERRAAELRLQRGLHRTAKPTAVPTTPTAPRFGVSRTPTP